MVVKNWARETGSVGSSQYKRSLEGMFVLCPFCIYESLCFVVRRLKHREAWSVQAKWVDCCYEEVGTSAEGVCGKLAVTAEKTTLD
jgi:hypothetical protein